MIYGVLGWTMEIIWTGLGSLWSGNIMLASFTYLWMFPIYGLAIFLEPLHDKINNFPWLMRGGIWVMVIFAIEYLTGLFLRTCLGQCPWDYCQATLYHVQGLIRLDYIPAWFLAGLIFERIHRFLDKIVL